MTIITDTQRALNIAMLSGGRLGSAGVETAIDALDWAASINPGSRDSDLARLASDRLKAYPHAMAEARAKDLLPTDIADWVRASVRDVATEATSVRVRREGLVAYEALIRAEGKEV